MVMNGFVSLIMAPWKQEKDTFSIIIAMVAKRENKCSFKKMSWLDKHEARKNVTTSNIYILKKNAPNLENKLVFHIMTTFSNFALIIETN